MEGSQRLQWIMWMALAGNLYLLGAQAYDTHQYDSDGPDHLFGLNQHNIEKRAYSTAYSFRNRGKMTGGFARFGGRVRDKQQPSQLVEFAGGCKGRPVVPANAHMRCAKFSGCRVSCLTGYMILKEQKQLFLICHEGEWHIEGTELKTIPNCEAICLPPCQHNEICVAPNECNCPKGYGGPQCQYLNAFLNIGPLPANAERTCNSRSCTITCNAGHQFPDGSSIVNMTYKDSEWTPSRSNWTSIPDCQPICLPPCQHNGICVAPNECNCPKGYSGPQCQYLNACLNIGPLPANAERTCNSRGCTITCEAGHQFPDGSSIVNMTCKDGEWTLSRSNWTSIPDCQSNCNPPCQNGGVCLASNVCQCSLAYRGLQCQYDAMACSPKKLNFNGGYECHGDEHELSCTISCPAGANFKTPPAETYTCIHAEGIFYPQPVPQCANVKFGKMLVK